MTLPASQQRALNEIDELLRRGDPRLATMFNVFTELNRQEGMPAVETLQPTRQWGRPGRRPPRPGRRRGHHAASRGRPVRRAPRWLPPTRLRGRRDSRLGTLLVLPLLVAATLSLIILAILATPSVSPRRCGQAATFLGPVRADAGSGCAGSGATQPAGAGTGSGAKTQTGSGTGGTARSGTAGG